MYLLKDFELGEKGVDNNGDPLLRLRIGYCHDRDNRILEMSHDSDIPIHILFTVKDYYEPMVEEVRWHFRHLKWGGEDSDPELFKWNYKEIITFFEKLMDVF